MWQLDELVEAGVTVCIVRSGETWHFCVQEFRLDPEGILELLSGLIQGKDQLCPSFLEGRARLETVRSIAGDGEGRK